MTLLEAFLCMLLVTAAVIIVFLVIINNNRTEDIRKQDYEKKELLNSIKDLESQLSEEEKKIQTAEKMNLELKNLIDRANLYEDNKQSLQHVSKLVEEKTIQLKSLDEEYQTTKNQATKAQQKLQSLIDEIQNINSNLSQKREALRAVDNFVKDNFNGGLPYIDYEDFFKQNNFEIVLNMLDDCIKVAPQFETELKKIEWNLCYLPYKKTFIKEFSRSGIYMLELKQEYESEALKELGLKRVNDNKGAIVYIGQASNIYDRWTTHIKKMLKIEPAGGEKLYKFKPLMFKWKVIEWCDCTMLNEREKFWIDSLKSDEFGLNNKVGNK